MPFLLTSVQAGASAGIMPATPDPDTGFVWTDRLLYHFRSTSDVFTDASGTVPAKDNDPIAAWGNRGSRENAVQSAAANRPVLRTGGLNGHPWIDCTQAAQQFFEDLAISHPASFTLDPFTVFVVTDQLAPELYPAVLGSTLALGGKTGFYFRPPAGQQIHFVKAQLRSGDVAHPQVVMAAAGRNAAGGTGNASSYFWIRRNGVSVWTQNFETTNINSSAIASTQFLRCTGIVETGGYFQGRLYEFLLYEGTLDDATTFAIEAFLHDKYGIAQG